MNCLNSSIPNKYKEYANDVVNGKINACKYIKEACQRYLDWFNIYEFREDRAEKVVKFISMLKHYVGEHNEKPFLLLPYQKWIVYNIFGFYYPNTDKRVINYVYLELARKNGKSAFAAAISLYMLCADGENGSEVEFVANNAKQAKLSFIKASNFLSSIDKNGKHFQRYRDSIKFDERKSILQILSSEASGNDGYNSYCFVLDECHEQKDSRLWDVMCSSQGMRKNPLAIITTTAGFNLYGFCYNYRRTCTEILSGLKKDDSQFVAIYTMDDDDDWTDSNNWIKANPSLGVTVYESKLQQQIEKAKNNTSLEVGIRTKNLNQWISTSDIWISNDLLMDATEKVDLDDFKESTCYIGVDLASVSDLTAVSVMIPIDGKFYFKTKYYLPQSALKDNSNCELYKDWKRKGYLTITDGNVTDYDYLLSDIIKVSNKLFIDKIAYDAYNATQWAINATAQGLPLEPYSQALWSFNRPTKEFERLIKSGRVVIDDNPITRWCFSNVVLKYDHNDNCLDISTTVPTPDGFTTIGDLKIGDYVFDENGHRTKVIGTTETHYNRECYRITFSNGSVVNCDGTHNWYVNYYSIDKNRKTIMKMGLKNTEWLYQHFLNGQGRNWIHTIYNKPLEYSEKSFSIDPYQLGIWLGDGSSWDSSFSCEEKDLPMYKTFENEYEVKYTYDEGKTYNIHVSGGFRTKLKNLNLLKNKHIPQEYFEGSISQRLELLRGLMDTDGTCHKRSGQCVINQVKENLIKDISRLLNSLGIKHTYHKYRNWYILQFYTDMRVFNLERKYKNQENYKPKKDIKNNVVVKVEKIDSVPTRCITVENESHLFLITNDYLVTSNCKPTKLENQQKIDGTISMIESLGIYLNQPQFNNEVFAV